MKKTWKRGCRRREEGECEPHKQPGSTVLLGTVPVEKTNQPVLISSWSFITTTVKSI